MRAQLRALIRELPDVHDAVLSYDKVSFDELYAAATERGVHCSKAALADFLAGEGIKIGWGSRAGETKRRRVRA